VDVLVHNAAVGAMKPYDKMRTSHWDLTIESSLRPFWLLTKHCRMRAGGSVIGISSMGSQRYIPGYVAMGAAKGGIEALTRQLAVELAAQKVRVNTVCGGLVQTDTLQYLADGERMLKRVEQRAKAMGLESIFVLTTRTMHWFIKRGFAQVDPEWLPEARKRKYNWDRRSQVLVKTLK
jgi:NAD(P)-dependent dehydrogenase (short-subunit alcohol dehydrogenase family)